MRSRGSLRRTRRTRRGLHGARVAVCARPAMPLQKLKTTLNVNVGSAACEEPRTNKTSSSSRRAPTTFVFSHPPRPLRGTRYATRTLQGAFAPRFVMLARAASRAASAVARVAPPVATAAWTSLRNLSGSSRDDETAAAEETRGATDDPEDDSESGDDEDEDEDGSEDDAEVPLGAVTAEAGEDDDVDHEIDDLYDDEEGTSDSSADGGVQWTGGVEPHRPSGKREKEVGSVFSLMSGRDGSDIGSFDATDVDRFWDLSIDTEKKWFKEGLPRGVKEEFEASGTRRIMFRKSDLEIREAVKAGNKGMLLDGRRGAGKTTALVNLVAWARAENYFVVYVPSAKALTLDSSYTKDEKTGMWDTPEHAGKLLRWILAGNESGLQELKSDDGKTLSAIATEGVESLDKGGDGKVVVEAALAVLEGLKTAAKTGTKVMFAIDEYNALFGPTDMHEVLGARRRGVIAAGDTRVGAALRDATGATTAGMTYVGVVSGTISLSTKLTARLACSDPDGQDKDGQFPETNTLTHMEVPRFNPREIACLVRHYDHARSGLDAVDATVDHAQLALRLKVLTQGNAKEMREMMEALG